MAYKKMQQNYGTRKLVEEYKEERRAEKSDHKRKKKEWINAELDKLELLKSQNDFRRFYKDINTDRKQFKPEQCYVDMRTDL
ncbi:hypothetical protein ANN_29118 [Periplaneta americana]|uniref:Uncharacterized protein n=1 Tax=Periplaneta americana TaxID=6978 RepID=A0ABQ8RU53_PERAM|nr:hypothetical protein ANN_29118 [Periplaneta americana]